MKKLCLHELGRLVYGFLWVLIIFLGLEINLFLDSSLLMLGSDLSLLRNEENGFEKVIDLSKEMIEINEVFY
jgi:hypothetical protein